MTITLDDLGGTRRPGDFKRTGDEDSSPIVSDPSGATVRGGKRKGEVKWVTYGRPSSFGKKIENSYNLLKWKERELSWAIGDALREYQMACERGTLGELDKRVSAVVDAWRSLLALERNADDRTWRAAADTLVKAAYGYAKTSLAAQRGTHGHAITEDNDEGRDWLSRAKDGEDLGVPTHVQAAVVAVWQKMLDETGMVILATELPIVHDKWRQAGTLDRIVLLTRDVEFVTAEGEVITIPAGTVLVLDIKTGKLYTDGKVVRFWKGYAVQCATYNDGVPYDTEANERLLWAEVLESFQVDDTLADNRWAIIAHLPIAEALAGRAVCRLIAVDLEAGRSAARIVLDAGAWESRTDVFHLAPSHEYTVDVVCPTADAAQPTTDDDPFADLPTVADKPFEPKPERRTLPTRIRAVAVQDDDALNSGEGANATAEAIDAVKGRLEVLRDTSPAAFATLLDIVRQAVAESPTTYGISTKVPSQRRINIMRGLLALAEHFGDELAGEHLRCVGVVIADAQQLAVPIHKALLKLTPAEARAFHQACMDVVTGDLALTFADDAAPRWVVPTDLVANPAA